MSRGHRRAMARDRSRSGSAAVALASLIAGGCAGYDPRPIAPGESFEDFETRRLDGEEITAFLRETQRIAWPPDAWDLHSLTLAAFYYSPALDVARARWAVAQGEVITAGGRPNPALNVALGYNATTPTEEITPWIPEAVLDIPVEVAGKRGIRIARARSLSEAARLGILTEAWGVRRRVRQAALSLYAARATDSLLSTASELQTEIVRILEGQLALGEASAYTVSQARIDLEASRIAAVDASRRRIHARSELADAIGIPPSALDGVALSLRDLGQVSPDPPTNEIRLRALVNRPDILAGLMEYEASQSALQLEIRKQYPDFSIGPGYQLDQTDAKWTLGLGLILPLFNRNRGPIEEARARREAAAARFLALQSSVLAELEEAIAASRDAVGQVQVSDRMLGELTRREATAAAAHRIGEISRLELLSLRVEIVNGARLRLDAVVQAQEAVGALEDAMQSPLESESWILARPERTASP